MKQKITQIIILIFLSSGIFAQVPLAFKYQAVVRDANGNIIPGKPVSFRISVLSGTATGAEVYKETHTGKMTNSFGLAELEIGKGTPVSGTFGGINWLADSYFVKVELDVQGGSNFVAMGTSQLLGVPYALAAKTVENNNDADADPTNEIQQVTLSGTQLTLSKGGGTVILPSSGGGDNWGTQTIVTDASLSGNGTPLQQLKIADSGVGTAKLADGAVNSAKITDGSISTTDLANNSVTIEKLPLGGDNTKVLFGDGTWNKVGWFQSGGVITNTESNRVTIASTSTEPLQIRGASPLRVRLIEDANQRGYIGSLSVADPDVDFGTLSANTTGKLHLTIKEVPKFTLDINGNAGIGTTEPTQKLDIEGQIRIRGGAPGAGKVLTSGNDGTATWAAPPTGATGWTVADNKLYTSGADFVGIKTQNPNTTLHVQGVMRVTTNSDGMGGFVFQPGINSIMFQNASNANLYTPAGYNLLLQSGNDGSNVVIGGANGSRKLTVEGSTGMVVRESSIGKSMVYDPTFNIMSFTGGNAKIETMGTNKLTLAAYSFDFLGTYSNPVRFMGPQGIHITLHEDDIYRGYIGSVTGNAADIDFGTAPGSGASLHLVTGNLNTRLTVTSTGYVGIGTTLPSYLLHVNGDAAKNSGGSSWINASDIRLKNIDGKYEKGLAEILYLNPVRFHYKDGNPRQIDSKPEQIGFIAQEVKKIFPEAVSEGNDGYLEFNMHPVLVALVNAAKQLKSENNMLSQENEKLKSDLKALAAKVNQIENQLPELKANQNRVVKK